jgi:hypothetical protein
MIRFRVISVGIISVGIIQGARFADLTGATRPLAPAAVGAALLAAGPRSAPPERPDLDLAELGDRMP